MTEVFVSTVSQMMVLALCMVVGFVFKRTGALPESSGVVMSKLEYYIFGPALTLSTFMTYCTVQSLKEQAILVVCGALIAVLALLISGPLSGLFVKSGYERNIYKYSFTISNFGYMGNAIVMGVLGEEMLYSYLMLTLPLSVTVYTWGIATLMPPKNNEKQSPFKWLITPPMIACIIGVVLGLVSAESVLPDFVLTTLDYLKGCMAPVAMVLTGFVIGSYDLKSMLINKKVYVASLLRLIVLPIFFVAVLYFGSQLLGISREVMRLPLTLVLFAFFNPMGLNTIVYPIAYGADPKTGASMALVSSALCMVTIPLMYALFTIVV